MGKPPKNINYLKEISVIKELLRDTPMSKKSLTTYLYSLDKFFPFLVNRSKEEYKELKDSDLKEYSDLSIEKKNELRDGFKEKYEELKDFDLKEYYDLSIEEKNKVRENWAKKNIHENIFNEWKELKQNTKSNLLMKWVNELVKNKYLGNGKTERNTFLNYVWRIQGFLTKLGFDYEANPRNMDKITSNGFHLKKDITYEDVIELYESIPKLKYKLILKLIMYCGLNPADIVKIKPIDFEQYENTDNYVLIREREKTKHKGTQYLIMFHKNFLDEFKDYFEMKRIIDPKEKNINKHKTDKHFHIEKEGDKIKLAYLQYNWNNDEKVEIFGDINSNTISETLKYHRKMNNLNPMLMPMTIRRLCFTMIKDVFTLTDQDIYELWTQHKAKMLTRHYIIDLLTRTIEKDYIRKIENKVLINSVESYRKKIKDYKNGMKEILNLRVDNSVLKMENLNLKIEVKGIMNILQKINNGEKYNFEEEREKINKEVIKKTQEFKRNIPKSDIVIDGFGKQEVIIENGIPTIKVIEYPKVKKREVNNK